MIVELRSYSELNSLGYHHKTINHSQYFVDPNNLNIHSNIIEGFWMHLRKCMPNIKKDDELYTLYSLELSQYENLHLYVLLHD